MSIGSLKTAGSDYGEQIRVERVVVHPRYDRATMANDLVTMANDLALVELRYTSVAAPVWLFNLQPAPTSGVILGYGVTTPTGITVSDVLRFVDVSVVASREQCAADLQLEIHASMFCAGGQANEDACDGDSGGPLVVTATSRASTAAVSAIVLLSTRSGLTRSLGDVLTASSTTTTTAESDGASESGETALLGVISFGRGCGAQFVPGVYANVSAAFDFITNMTPDTRWTSPAPMRGIVAPGPPSSGTGSGTGAGSTSSGAAGKQSGSLDGGGNDAPVAAGGDGGERSDDSPRTPTPTTTTAGDGVTTAHTSSPSYDFELPTDVSTSVRAAVVTFLVGEYSQVRFASAESLLTRSRIVFRSSVNLSAIEHLVASHDAKPLHQRTRRLFAPVSSRATDSRSEC